MEPLTPEEIASLVETERHLNAETEEAQTKRLVRKGAPLGVQRLIDLTQSGDDKVALSASKTLADLFFKASAKGDSDEESSLDKFLNGVSEESSGN